MNGYLLDPHYFCVQKVFRGISGWCTSERGRRERGRREGGREGEGEGSWDCHLDTSDAADEGCWV